MVDSRVNHRKEKKMSDRFNNPSMQGMLSQVIKEIQNGLNRLEQTINQSTQAAPGAGPAGEETYTPPAQQTQPQPAPATPSKPYSGQRWEYKVVYINFRGQISSEGQQVGIGRGERRSTFVRSYLDQLGDQGWELSGVSPLGETENSYFIFKRPATGDRPVNSASTSSSGQRVEIEEVDESGNGFVAQA
jgi:hypothetical protein